jgi:hypothetical protein
MRTLYLTAVPWLVLATAVGGCGDDDSPAVDAGRTDRDAGPTEGGIDDGGIDGGAIDAASIDDGGTATTLCTSFAVGTSRGSVENTELTEISGVVASRRQPGVLYVHNDSGESVARFFAIDIGGGHLAEITLPGASSNDWEDIAIGPHEAGDGHAIYLGDIGDNAARTSGGEMGRSRILVHRAIEPDVALDGSSPPITIEAYDTFRFVYPDHPHDAESMFVDPANGDLYLITKENDGLSTVFRAAAPIATDRDVILEPVGGIAFGSADAPGNSHATAADIAPAGNAILVRTYLSVLWWERPPGTPIARAFSTAAAVLPMAAEMQGEAVAFAGDGRAYFTISEGRGAAVNYFACAD